MNMHYGDIIIPVDVSPSFSGLVDDLIVIEGADGSGKKTQSKMLYGYLLEHSKPDEIIMSDFPQYEKPTGQLIKHALSGAYGDAFEINPFIASTAYAYDRWDFFYNLKKQREAEGKTEPVKVCISNRYTDSNLIQQGAKIEKFTTLEFYKDWLYRLEYLIAKIPVPKHIIYLDVPPEVSDSMMSERYNGDESKKDVHETYEYAKKVYDHVHHRIPLLDGINFHFIDCCDINGDLLPKYAIFSKILQSIGSSSILKHVDLFRD